MLKTFDDIVKAKIDERKLSLINNIIINLIELSEKDFDKTDIEELVDVNDIVELLYEEKYGKEDNI